MSVRLSPRVGARHRAFRERRRELVEQRRSVRKAARDALRAREEAIEAALRRSRWQATRSAASEPLGQVLQPIRHLLGLARVARVQRDRVEQIFRALQGVPNLLRADALPWALLLASVPWHSAPRSFRVGPGSAVELRRAFERHLLGPWPAPLFLGSALRGPALAVARVPLEDQWAVSLLAWLSRGRSLRDAVGSLLPAGFTRAMCHRFTQGPSGVTPILALRRVQAEAFGAPPPFADRLVQTQLGGWQGQAAEAAWHPVVAWASARPWITSMPAAQLADLVRWLGELIRSGRQDSLRGRTAASVAREVEAFVSREEAEGVSGGPSGLRGFRHGEVVIRELRSAKELVVEGQRMGHCVAMYAPLVASRAVALFSLEGPGEAATIEVIPATRQVVQVKGRHNTPPSTAVRRLVASWCERTALEAAFGD